MVRVSVLLCFVLVSVTMVSVSFAENNEGKSTDLKKVKGQETDQSITKVNDDGEHDDDHDHDHDNDNDKNHDDDNDDDDDHDHDRDDDHENDNEDGDDNDKDDHDDDNEDGDDNDNDDGDDGDNEDDEKETLGVYELKKGSLTVKFTSRGASIVSLLFPDKNGKMEDVVLGYDSVNEYMNEPVFFGASVGRVANRREKTVANDARNTIHGGKKGFKHAIWRVAKHRYNGKKPYIVFTYTSLDGDQGFPGKLHVTATYKLVGENQLKLVMEATARGKATAVNLVHHSYWNLGGHSNGDILSEEIQILGSGYAHVDDNLIPTGKILSVKGTSYDFLKLRPIKDNINEIKLGHGINYCLDGVANQMRKVVVLVDKKSKRKMELTTDQSGLKFYTGRNLKTMKGKNGSVYKAYSGLCLETHSFSNAINNQYLPSQIVKPGGNFKHTLLFKFSMVP
ncbi:hypothetical protein Bca101_061034 [Brassica carinata]